MPISKLIYKQRCNNPNNPNTPIKNRNHIKYIATRTGTVIAKDTSHGLFGKLKEMPESGNIKDLTKLLEYTDEKSKQKTHFYQGVISLKEEDAKNLGYLRREEWKQLLDNQIPNIAKEMNIPLHRLEWVGAVHYEKEHPHCHIVYWDSEQDVRTYYVKPQTADRIRSKLIKEVYENELSALYQQKDAGRKSIKDYSDQYIEDLFKSVSFEQNLTPIMFSKFSKSRLNSLSDDLMKISQMLPAKGRLTYALVPAEAKKALEDTAIKVIGSSADLKNIFHQYIASEISIAKVYSSSDENVQRARDRAYNKAVRIIANSILSCIKNNRNQEWEQRSAEYKQEVMKDMIMEIFSLFSRQTQVNHARSNTLRFGELSKQARREKAKAMENTSGVDWER